MTYQEDGLAETCIPIVRQVLAKRGWGLVEDEAAFVAEVLEEALKRLANMSPAAQRRKRLARVIEDATINRYSHIWHTACAANDTVRQQQAFVELYQYLYPIALYHANQDVDIAKEGMQEALIIIWQKLSQLRDPGAFARYAGVIVSRQASQKLRLELRRRHKEVPESELLRSDSEEAGFGTDETSNAFFTFFPSVEPPNYEEDLQIELEKAIWKCLRYRSKRQRQVIFKSFFEEKTTTEIADELKMTPNRVRVLRHRAAKTLRKCKKFLALAKEWCIN